MSDLHFELLRADITFWALLIMGGVSDGVGWKAVFTVLALAVWFAKWRLERRATPPDERFWSHVWRR